MAGIGQAVGLETTNVVSSQEDRGLEEQCDPTTSKPHGRSKEVISGIDARLTRGEKAMGRMEAKTRGLGKRVNGTTIRPSIRDLFAGLQESLLGELAKLQEDLTGELRRMQRSRMEGMASLRASMEEMRGDIALFKGALEARSSSHVGEARRIEVPEPKSFNGVCDAREGSNLEVLHDTENVEPSPQEGIPKEAAVVILHMGNEEPRPQEGIPREAEVDVLHDIGNEEPRPEEGMPREATVAVHHDMGHEEPRPREVMPREAVEKLVEFKDISLVELSKELSWATPGAAPHKAARSAGKRREQGRRHSRGSEQAPIWGSTPFGKEVEGVEARRRRVSNFQNYLTKWKGLPDGEAN